MDSDFFVTLVSNTKEPKTNKCNDFTVHLSHPLQLAGDWECCLSEIQYCKSWVNLPCEYEEETKQNTTDIYIGFPDDTKLLAIQVPAGHYSSVPDLLSSIDKTCKQAAEKYSKEATAIFESSDGMQSDELAQHFDRKARIEFLETFTFTYDTILKKITVHFKESVVHEVILSDYLKFLMGFESRTLISDKETAKFSPDLTAGISALFVYTDIIEGELIGDQIAPLLRIVHVDSDTPQNTSVEKIFFSEHYVKVLTKYITSIRIQIMSDSGKHIQFGNGKIYCKLRFRPCRLVGF